MQKTLILFLLLTVDGAYAFSSKNTVNDCKEKAKGPCYEFSGRARLYNNKHIRIWKKGTKRMYQVASQTSNAFSDMKHLSMATEIHAIFDVCFLQPEVPSGFSAICVQTVKNAKTSHMPE